eukprot:2859538-Pleurochrysis_carterae.AAC.2
MVRGSGAARREGVITASVPLKAGADMQKRSGFDSDAVVHGSTMAYSARKMEGSGNMAAGFDLQVVDDKVAGVESSAIGMLPQTTSMARKRTSITSLRSGHASTEVSIKDGSYRELHGMQHAMMLQPKLPSLLFSTPRGLQRQEAPSAAASAAVWSSRVLTSQSVSWQQQHTRVHDHAVSGDIASYAAAGLAFATPRRLSHDQPGDVKDGSVAHAHTSGGGPPLALAVICFLFSAAVLVASLMRLRRAIQSKPWIAVQVAGADTVHLCSPLSHADDTEAGMRNPSPAPHVRVATETCETQKPRDAYATNGESTESAGNREPEAHKVPVADEPTSGDRADENLLDFTDEVPTMTGALPTQK